jgi:hypothetical protein
MTVGAICELSRTPASTAGLGNYGCANVSGHTRFVEVCEEKSAKDAFRQLSGEVGVIQDISQSVSPLAGFRIGFVFLRARGALRNFVICGE